MGISKCVTRVEPFGPVATLMPYDDSSRSVGKRERRLVRKGGLEPPRYCYRQPLKLAEILCLSELIRICRTDVGRKRAEEHASDDFIRTDSHTGAGRMRVTVTKAAGFPPLVRGDLLPTL